MKQTTIPSVMARRLALHSQLLNGQSSDALGLRTKIDTLGYVQIDTIAVIQRAHHHTLWVRQHDYSLDMLHQLQKDKAQGLMYPMHFYHNKPRVQPL